MKFYTIVILIQVFPDNIQFFQYSVFFAIDGFQFIFTISNISQKEIISSRFKDIKHQSHFKISLPLCNIYGAVVQLCNLNIFVDPFFAHITLLIIGIKRKNISPLFLFSQKGCFYKTMFGLVGSRNCPERSNFRLQRSIFLLC